MLTKDSDSVLIIAAEESSALYAQRLLEHWKVHHPHLQSFGIGNQKMVDLGFHAIADSHDMAVMGLSEIWSKWALIKSTYHKILEECRNSKPKFALLLDYPGFNLRIAKDLKKLGIPVVYYISPQVWAWKKGRVKKIRQYVDEMLVLFPFEKEFYDKEGVVSEFVGHPALDELEENLLSSKVQSQLRSKYGLRDGQRVLGLMPGSRRVELQLHLQLQLDVAQELYKKHKDLHVALLLAPGIQKEKLILPETPFSFSIIQADPLDMIALCDVILCASGTATLMVALVEKPMVIMYKMKALSGWLAKRFVKIPFFGLVNVIMGKEIIQERFQERANVFELTRLLDQLITDESYKKATIQSLKDLKKKLGEGGATLRVASILEKYLA